MHAVEVAFPDLQSTSWEQTSPQDLQYNCIAWAAGDPTCKWWPDAAGIGYWPPGVPREESLQAFIQAFESIGYQRDADRTLEPGFDKVALYAAADRPKHAARQLTTGKWSSKLGDNIDIEHTLAGLEGDLYGVVVHVLKRPRSSTGD